MTDSLGSSLLQAETWLGNGHGWAQVAKLKGRSTSQGLIAVTVDGRYAALAEVNCKTKFVASNEKFRCLAETVISAVLNHAKSHEIQNEVQRSIFHADNLKDLLAVDGKPLSDHSALAISNMGENINLSRALAVSTQSSDIKLFGGTFPMRISSKPVSCGKYGAIVAIKCKESDTILGTNLCQHIIGIHESRNRHQPQVCVLFNVGSSSSSSPISRRAKSTISASAAASKCSTRRLKSRKNS